MKKRNLTFISIALVFLTCNSWAQTSVESPALTSSNCKDAQLVERNFVAERVDSYVSPDPSFKTFGSDIFNTSTGVSYCIGMFPRSLVLESVKLDFYTNKRISSRKSDTRELRVLTPEPGMHINVTMVAAEKNVVFHTIMNSTQVFPYGTVSYIDRFITAEGKALAWQRESEENITYFPTLINTSTLEPLYLYLQFADETLISTEQIQFYSDSGFESEKVEADSKNPSAGRRKFRLPQAPTGLGTITVYWQENGQPKEWKFRIWHPGI